MSTSLNNAAKAFAASAALGGTVAASQAGPFPNYFDRNDPRMTLAPEVSTPSRDLTVTLSGFFADTGEGVDLSFIIKRGGVDSRSESNLSIVNNVMTSAVSFSGVGLEETTTSYISTNMTSTSSILAFEAPVNGDTFDIITGDSSGNVYGTLAVTFFNASGNILPTDDYVYAVRHINDFDFAFASLEQNGVFRDISIGDVSVVPAPAGAALLGLGGLAASRRRRAPEVSLG